MSFWLHGTTTQAHAHSRNFGLSSLTNHHGGKGHGLAELPLNELGHEGGEACQQRSLVDLC